MRPFFRRALPRGQAPSYGSFASDALSENISSSTERTNPWPKVGLFLFLVKRGEVEITPSKDCLSPEVPLCYRDFAYRLAVCFRDRFYVIFLWFSACFKIVLPSLHF